MLFIDQNYYCYTLEDTYHKVKIAGQTRIPSGIYTINFLKYDTPLTLKYRKRYPDWFTYHLHVENVPNFTGIYIHSGGNHEHTEGCILVSDSLNASDKNTYLFNSRNTFKKLYAFLSQTLNSGKKVRIIIKDESWIKELNQ